MSNELNPHIFREYDIRGVADRDLPQGLVTQLGRALGSHYASRGLRRIAVGGDCRHSTPRLRDALVEGLVSTGMQVTDIGVVPTPLLYFSVFHWDLDGGIQITGSHNPPEDNGFKMMCGKDSLYGSDIQGLREVIESRSFVEGVDGGVTQRDILREYVAYLQGNLSLARTDLRFAIDAGNGAGGPTAVAAMDGLGLSPHALLCDMDPNFPVHHPDPSQPENLELLTREVRERGLAFGVAYDGDADRIGVIDREGAVLWGDRLLALFSRDILKKHPGARIIGEVKCSQAVYDDIAKHGGSPIIWKTGHSLIKAKMKEEGALLAGEMSGHMFFRDRYYGFDDAIYASLRLAELLAREDLPLSALLADLPTPVSTPELRVPSSDAQKFDVVAHVLEHFRKDHEVLDVDGARITFDKGWGLVRASNTQPVLVTRFEAEDEASLNAIRSEVEAVIASA